MAAVNTLKQQLADVTALQDSTLTPGTVELVLGSDFTGLAPCLRGPQRPPRPSPRPAPAPRPVPEPSQPRHLSQSSTAASPNASGPVSGLAQSNGGITAAASCSSDSSAFSGPLSP